MRLESARAGGCRQKRGGLAQPVASPRQPAAAATSARTLRSATASSVASSGSTPRSPHRSDEITSLGDDFVPVHGIANRAADHTLARTVRSATSTVHVLLTKKRIVFRGAVGISFSGRSTPLTSLFPEILRGADAMPAKIRLLIDAPRLCAIALVAFVISRLRFGSSKHTQEPGEARVHHCRLCSDRIEPGSGQRQRRFHRPTPNAARAWRRRAAVRRSGRSRRRRQGETPQVRDGPRSPARQSLPGQNLVDESIAGMRDHQMPHLEIDQAKRMSGRASQ